MSDIYDLLRAGDPIRDEGLPPVVRVDRMLQRLRADAPGGDAHAPAVVDRRRRTLRRLVAVGGLSVAFAIVATALLRQHGRQPSSHSSDPMVPDMAPASMTLKRAPSSRNVVPVRHLQFETPEGIKVFWTFNPDLPEE